MPRQNKNRLEGQKFGRLTVIRQVENGPSGHIQWLCKCECGNETIVTSSNLLRGKVKSCGCLHRDTSRQVMVNLEKGWMTTCKYCGKEFRTLSNKQVYCSVECSFKDRAKLVESGCIEWQGNINSQGYGVFRGPEKKIILAHRYAWERFFGPIPDDLCVCHKCDNRRCVNPEHFFLGTRYDNNHDRSLKGRSGKRTYSEEERARYSEINSGEKNKSAVLTEKEVKDIYNIRKTTNLSFKKIGDLFNVSKATIMSICKRRTWKHVTLE